MNLIALSTISTLVLVAASSAPWAADSQADLATKATNPVGSTNQLQLQNLYYPDNKNSDGDANSFVVQPILSFALPDGGYFESIVTRITIPYISTPEVNGQDASGWGDTTALIIATHSNQGSKAGEFSTWGPVAAVGARTSTDDMTRGGAWTAGPGLIGLKNVVFDNGNSLMYGAIGWHLWDFQGNADRSVSLTSGFPIFIYKFGSLFNQKGWYVRAPDDALSYDWLAEEFTQVPLGLGLGRAFKMGKQPVNAFVSAWYNAADPDTAATPDWAIKASFSLVFPK